MRSLLPFVRFVSRVAAVAHDAPKVVSLARGHQAEESVKATEKLAVVFDRTMSWSGFWPASVRWWVGKERATLRR